MLQFQPSSTARYLASTHASGEPLSEPPTDLREWLATAGDRPLDEIVEALQLDQVQRWREGQRVPAETYFQLCPALRDIPEYALDLIVGEFALREELGESPSRAEYLWRFPQYEAALALQFELDEALARNARMAVPPALAGCIDSSSADGAAMVSPWPRVPGYEIERELGRGAMGVVYQARQVRLNRPCALKMVLAWEQAGVESAVRFLAEAETVARLQHPNIVQIHAYGEYGGRPYLELEYVAGGSLAERLDGTPQPPRDAARLVETLARGLDEAHRLGIVHRDLKPANILLASGEREAPVSPASPNAGLANCIPKIADFGLAKSMQVDAGLTQTQAIMGSPSYMAPEQAEGHTRDVGPAADIYALGAVFYELLTGRPPFKAPTVLATLQQVKSAEPVAPRQLQPGVPRDLDTICLKCLAKEPGRRYASARELAFDLRRFLDDRPILARRVSPWERTRRWARRNRAVAASLATIVTLLVAAAVAATVEAARFQRLADEKERQRAGAFRHLYLADMRVAHQDLEAGQIVRLHDLLGKYLPKPDAPDVRGWEWYYLLSLCHQDALTLRGHQGRVFDVVFGPDGRWLASAGRDDASIRLWDLTDGRERLTLDGGGGGVVVLAVSRDGRRLASGHRNGGVTIWDTQTGERQLAWQAHDDAILGLSWDADGARLATSTIDGKLEVWSSADGSLVRAFDTLHGIHSAFSPDGRRIACGYDVIEVWDPASGMKLVSLPAKGEILSIAWHPNGELVAVGDYSALVRVLNATTGEELLSIPHSSAVESVAFSPDGLQLATATRGQQTRVFDAVTGLVRNVFQGHLGWIKSVEWRPDGGQLASAGFDGTVRLWDFEAEPVSDKDEAFDDVRYNPHKAPDSFDGDRAAFARQFVGVRAWSHDGTRLAYPVRNRAWIQIWDTVNRKLLHEFPAHEKGILRLVWSEDGTRLASASFGDIGIWDTGTGKRLHELLGHAEGHWIGALAWSPDGALLASAGWDQTVRIWDTAGGRLRHSLVGHTRDVGTVAFAPDGKRLASAGSDGAVKLWDPATGREVLTLRGSGTPGEWAQFGWSGDGRRLVGLQANDTGLIRSWNAARGYEYSVSPQFAKDLEAAGGR